MSKAERSTTGRDGGEDAQLLQDFIHELGTPVQFLGLNLSFLGHGCRRMAQILEAHHAAMAAYPGDVAERLVRVEGELDLDFLQAEIPKVLAESLEGLSTISRIMSALQQIHDGGPGASGAGGGEDDAC